MGFFTSPTVPRFIPATAGRNYSPTCSRYAPALKARLAPEAPFGLGLRLSAAESPRTPGRGSVGRVSRLPGRHDLYVFTLNGFPYGDLTGPSVKARIFAPDWREESRVRYTLDLIEILRRLLPAGVEGSISTTPLSYKAWIAPGDAAGLGPDDPEPGAGNGVAWPKSRPRQGN